MLGKCAEGGGGAGGILPAEQAGLKGALTACKTLKHGLCSFRKLSRDSGCGKANRREEVCWETEPCFRCNYHHNSRTLSGKAKASGVVGGCSGAWTQDGWDSGSSCVVPRHL